ncbi:UDP-glucose/GDP-mannose dehydrogenase family protein [Bacillus sp. WOD8 KX774193]|uniref:UDP-glucose dehydrogenase family protein n=1 Tax=Bacillus sp. WOD8 KX774193 TaxID=3096776 RepID=UPI002DBA6D38|nr:UDP-glucose/GDP-mannose dehydrogenase family protein [Bacillus sp. WOD8 KX774193]MEC3856829.1 UDP-glucose/GDP-mannose dehydrogenase family protein [Bacillus sp. WOD8 KX774193]
MNIAVVGTGYVGLVTGVCLSDIGHQVVCIDIDINKIEKMKKGISPIYEPGLEDLMIRNIKKGNLKFTNSYAMGFKDVQVVIIAVGTPQMPDGSANLQYIEAVAESIGEYVTQDVVVVIKSTVPVGTNDYVKGKILANLKNDIKIAMASNPEFLREGSAIRDTFDGDRIIIGTEDEETVEILEQMYKEFELPIYKTDIYSAEMIKYASNAFLATKISFINEISNICEKLGANVEDVANGMGMDKRIGRAFLNAGIGYGGSCFPKDTQALVQIAGNAKHDFELLRSVIQVNNSQQYRLLDKIQKRFNSVGGKTVALLGLAFKPNTDDMREAASIVLARELIELGINIKAYDPIAIENAKQYLPTQVIYTRTLQEALENADFAIIVTEWEEFKELDLAQLKELLKEPVLFDGRNCFELDTAREAGIEYHSIGRPTVYTKSLVKI